MEKRLQQLIKEANASGGTIANDEQIDQLFDVEYYLQDILATLYSFLQIYPEAAELFKPHLDLTLLAQLYDQVIPKLLDISVPAAERGSNFVPVWVDGRLRLSCGCVHLDQRLACLKRVKAYLASLGFTLLEHHYISPLIHGTSTSPALDHKSTTHTSPLPPASNGHVDRKGKGKDRDDGKGTFSAFRH